MIFLTFSNGYLPQIRFLSTTTIPKKATEQIEASKLIFTLDFNALKRADSLTPLLENSKATFVMIDHHQEPDDYAKVTFSNPKASSTCEMIYAFY